MPCKRFSGTTIHEMKIGGVNLVGFTSCCCVPWATRDFRWPLLITALAVVLQEPSCVQWGVLMTNLDAHRVKYVKWNLEMIKIIFYIPISGWHSTHFKRQMSLVSAGWLLDWGHASALIARISNPLQAITCYLFNTSAAVERTINGPAL